MRKVLLIALILELMPMLTVCAPTQIPAQTVKPNILYVFLDDADRKLMNRMTETRQQVAEEGVNFKDTSYPVPLCCPSRTSMQRGQYAHNTKVFSNEGASGGWDKFRAEGLQTSTYGTWVKRAGYRTGYFGKYINGYDAQAVPPGWDWWDVAYGKGLSLEQFNRNGEIITRPEGPTFDAYVAGQAETWLDLVARKGPPFMGVVSLQAPHNPAEAPPWLEDNFSNAPFPKSPAYDEADVSDKPERIKNLPRVSEYDEGRMIRLWRDKLRSVEYADRQVIDMLDILRKHGEFNSTYIVVWSDNGFHMGEHRLVAPNGIGDKDTAYNEDSAVPLWVRGPGIPHGVTSNELVSGIDLAPTFADMAGAGVPGFVDGRSFLPVSKGAPYRDYVYSAGGYSSGSVEVWQGVRTKNYSYTYYPATSEQELYRLSDDPYQLNNLMHTPTPGALDKASELRAKLVELQNCQADECRTKEE